MWGDTMAVVDVAVLAGRYRLIELIGQGGSTEVWRAEDGALGRQVAVKVWTTPGAADDDTPAGIQQAARYAARLVHPNVAQVYDIGTDGDRLFLVTELVTGQDLAALLAEHGPLPAARVAQIGAQTARVLAAAHAEGIVHGGLKPGNVLVTPDGTVKLTDLGTAATPDDGAGAYFSPEQVVGLTAVPASDLYALGCVLYELLVGHPPFTSGDPDDSRSIHRQHMETEPEPPGRLRPDIPAELEHAVLRMLAKNPANRPAGAERIAEVLQAVEVLQSITEAP
jgi:serine/threonine protein kinase